jgi:lipopolysaccharide/colanic/teichoic acid biosynthesis glycosyltransferase
LPIWSASPPARRRPWAGLKIAFDFTAAFILSVLLSPLIALLALAIRLSSRGPAVFRQRRVGRDGREFTMYKLRSMRVDAEARTGAVWAQEHDNRCTRIGDFLRARHMDELPQLFNVLKGEMSFVGPRPERPEFVEILDAQIPRYMDRLQVRPGITGLAQILLPPDHTIDDVRHKLAVDLYYIDNLGFGLDLRLILFTGMRFLRIPAGWCHRITHIPTLDAIPGATPEHAASLTPDHETAPSPNGKHPEPARTDRPLGATR